MHHSVRLRRWRPVFCYTYGRSPRARVAAKFYVVARRLQRANRASSVDYSPSELRAPACSCALLALILREVAGLFVTAQRDNCANLGIMSSLRYFREN